MKINGCTANDHCSESALMKSRGEKRPSRFSFINTLAISARGTSHSVLVASSALLGIIF